MPASKVYDMTTFCRIFSLTLRSAAFTTSSAGPDAGAGASASGGLTARLLLSSWRTSLLRKVLCSTHSSVKAKSEAAVAIVMAHGYLVDSPRQASVSMGYASPKTCTYLQIQTHSMHKAATYNLQHQQQHLPGR